MTPIQASLMNELGLFSDNLSCVSTKPVHRQTFAFATYMAVRGEMCSARCIMLLSLIKRKLRRWCEALQEKVAVERSWGALLILFWIGRIQGSGYQGRSVLGSHSEILSRVLQWHCQHQASKLAFCIQFPISPMQYSCKHSLCCYHLAVAGSDSTLLLVLKGIISCALI